MTGQRTSRLSPEQLERKRQADRERIAQTRADARAFREQTPRIAEQESSSQGKVLGVFLTDLAGGFSTAWTASAVRSLEGETHEQFLLRREREREEPVEYPVRVQVGEPARAVTSFYASELEEPEELRRVMRIVVDAIASPEDESRVRHTVFERLKRLRPGEKITFR